ncbi:DNA polymerase III subunit alpha [Weeksellaceae bacterium KMM 9724]|uniref:DNA polymerase III subunit alpha n=1 Tax=Profundicola chukchiensis TaxID=2961959 RepID=UPI002440229C|nr:DNA polymerase III subunit alpha [Profundicola chukchiensis]MDG4951215.1 DNA polymerase III subunit alpha [Profundicola chukchiensis]
MRYLIFDTETTGLPKNFNAPLSDSENWPRMVQLAWQIHDEQGRLIENHNHIIKPEGYTIPFNAAKIHGISTEKAIAEGEDLVEIINKFESHLTPDTIIIGHNIEFDINIAGAEMFRKDLPTENLTSLPIIDTKDEGTNYCQIPGGRGGGYKWPTLSELHNKLFGTPFDEAHNAAADVNATARCFFELVRLEVIPFSLTKFTPENYAAFKEHFPDVIQPYDIEVGTQIADSLAETDISLNLESKEDLKSDIDSPFFHFHNHSSFSILSATTKVDELVERAIKENMPAVGMTDMGNMMGAFHFIAAAEKLNKDRENPIIPIVGCEVYVSERYQQTKFTKDNPDRRFTQVLLAKNKAGYHNLAKISSTGYTDGYYMGFPRVGKEVILKFKENLIATTGALTSEIPNLILNVGETQAEEAFLWWKEHFGEDFYVELIRHGLEEENHVNNVLLEFARKHDVKVLAQNNTFYLDQSESEAHDILLCVRDGEKQYTPIGRGRDFRFGFPNNEFYFKSQAQMEKLFEDIPESISNFEDFIKKFEPYTLQHEVLLPKFDIPDEFKDSQDEVDGGVRGENNYLRHLTYEGAKARYGEITPEISERLDFELETIEKTGYPGYFLIVQDFTSQARKMGVSVGPGRGSAAGSAVAYCVGITNIDPIKYDLLFERFLNPDRVSLPDIDIDFDDRGRDVIIQWVVDKYGSSQVAQIITYGTMAGKSAVRDTGRVLDLPLSDTDRIAKKVHAKLNKMLDLDENEVKKKFNNDQIGDVMDLIKIYKDNTEESRIIQQAKVIEGSIRNTGVHACGVIITPTDIRELIPVAVAKEKSGDSKEKSENQIVTQFDNSVVENAGLLKMDFLGLKTLTIIMDAVELIKETSGVELIPDDFPLDDPKTYQEIFQKGKTTGVFQYESPGMQSNLKLLKPDKFDDLIAMNALYRPGPMAYIPNFIDRKHGREEIQYDLPEMEEYLSETYGITVYQEQVMLLSQKLANFTKGEADSLRKAMGKKLLGPLAELEPKFKKQAKENGHPEKVLDKIWKDWIAFTQYAFNKSHSTCYAYVAFQTAYLKAHYPAEFMAAVLSNNMNNIKQISFFMEECNRLEIPVLSPDVNESNLFFNVNKQGAIRFGLAAVKGVGAGAVESIVQERRENGRFESIFDFVKRVDLSQVNKRTLENLILAGAFDEVDKYHRGQYFFEDENGVTVLEKIVKFGQATQKGGNENQISLFGEETMQDTIQSPEVPFCQKWPEVYALNKEKEVVGVYISAHPLDKFKNEIKFFTNFELNRLNGDLKRMVNKSVKVGAIITDAKEFTSNKDGSKFGIITLNDYTDSYEFRVFGAEYLKLRPFLDVNQMVLVRLEISENKWSKKIFVNIKDVELLSEVIEKNAREVILNLDINDLNEDLLQQLMKVVSEHKGHQKLTVNLRDKEMRKTFKAQALGTKVDIQREFLDALSDIDLINFSLN